MAALRTSSPKRALVLKPLRRLRLLPRPRTLLLRENPNESSPSPLSSVGHLPGALVTTPRRLIIKGRYHVGQSPDAQPAAQPDRLQAALADPLRGFAAPAAG